MNVFLENCQCGWWIVIGLVVYLLVGIAMSVAGVIRYGADSSEEGKILLILVALFWPTIIVMVFLSALKDLLAKLVLGIARIISKDV